MQVRRLTVAAIIVLACCGAMAQDAPDLVLRNPHYFVIVGDAETAPTITMECRSFFARTSGMNVEVSDPDGEVRLKTSALVGQSLTKQVPGEPAELYLVSANQGSNAVIFDCDRPWAVYAGGRIGVGANGPVPEMFLYVPEETERFTLRISAVSPQEGGRVTLHRPDGSEALVMDGEFDAEEQQEVEVPEELRGQAWSLTWATPQTVDARLEDINVFVEGDLTPLLWIERGWAEEFGETIWQRHKVALAEEGAQ